MKKLIFIDDLVEVIQLQQDEMRRILDIDSNSEVEIESIQCNMANMTDCLDDKGEKQHEGEDRYISIHEKLDNIMKTINQATTNIQDNSDRVEVVIDLYLDDIDEALGLKLVKYILKHMERRDCFETRRFLITVTSSYISSDFSDLSDKLLSADERERVIKCYRPFFKDHNTNKFVIEKTFTAFPEFYYSHRCEDNGIAQTINRLLLDKDSVSGNTGTYYGNYFGLIYARLYKNEGD